MNDEDVAELTPEMRAAMRERMARFAQLQAETEPTTEDTSEGTKEPTEPEKPAPENVPAQITGKDVDWSKYDLDFKLRHLYPKSVPREVNGVTKWVVMLEAFHTSERSYGEYDGSAKPVIRNESTARNLGVYLGDMVNGPDGWQVAAILSSTSARAGVVLRREVPFVLPDPIELTTETHVEAPKDEELAATEAAALAFAANTGIPVEEGEPDSGQTVAS